MSNDTSSKKNNDCQKFWNRILTSVMDLTKLYEPHLSFWTSRPRSDLDFCLDGILAPVCGKPFWSTSHWLVSISPELRSDFWYCYFSLEPRLPTHRRCIVAVVPLHSFVDSYAFSFRLVASPVLYALKTTMARGRSAFVSYRHLCNYYTMSVNHQKTFCAMMIEH